MKADLTRDTFRSFKHFRRVLMQQGRVQLDADWNEQAAILLHYLQSLAAHLIGPSGGMANAFAVSALPGTPVTPDFQIGLGDYYVDGILCEADSDFAYVSAPLDLSQGNLVTVDRMTLDGIEFQENQYLELFDDVPPSPGKALVHMVVQIKKVHKQQLTLDLLGQGANVTLTNPKLRRVISYLKQPDYPQPDSFSPNVTSFLVYLDVWERHITYVEDNSIREVALGGPDTATRSKVIWQVKVTPGSGNSNPDAGAPWENYSITDTNFLPMVFGENRPRLKAMAKQKSASTDPCIIAPDAKYRGAENQLYRVEVHTGGTGTASFKWSRENGSVVFPIVSIAPGGKTTSVLLENLGRDDRFGLAEGDYVEIINDVWVLQNTPGPLLQVQAIDSGTLTVTLTAASGQVTVDSALGKPGTHPLLRRWDHKPGDQAEGGLTLGGDNAALIEETSSGDDKWLVLEDGIQIQFQPPVNKNQLNQYRTGDYWLIPARTATGDVEWPREFILDSTGTKQIVPIAKPPDGIQHHYAPLGVITLQSGKVIPTESHNKIAPLRK